MANLNKFNRQTLLDLREHARRSLFVFTKAIWNDQHLTEELHYDLCCFLQGLPPYGPWTRAGVFAWRGSLKSSAVRAWMAWKGLYGPAAGLSLDDVARYVAEKGLRGIEVVPGVCIPDWSCLLVEQRAENAKAHHEKLQAKFRWGAQAALLQDMYRDRLPPGFDGWNTDRTVFNRTDANAEPFLVHAGLDSKLESAHKDAIVGDDLEGADADKSDVPNAESEKFVLERAVPLLKEPATGQIVLAGTPHGGGPLAWKVRREFCDASAVGQGTLNNAERGEWKIWWKEIVDPNTGKTRWAERFNQKWVEDLLASARRSPSLRRMVDTQYLLREHSDAGHMFDMSIAERTAFTLEAGLRIRYPVSAWDGRRLGEDERPVFETAYKNTSLAHLRYFMHLDSKHRDPGDHKEGVRPSRAAIIVTGVAPDCHVFTVESWIKDAGLDEFIEQFFLMYRKWAPYRFTMDTVGAQIWFKNILRILEGTRYRDIVSVPRVWRPVRRLPQPSSLLIEAHKGNTSKEEYIIQALEVMLNLGYLHMDRKQIELWTEMEKFPSAAHPADGLDALAQGCHVWDRFADLGHLSALRAKLAAIREARMVEPITGYVRGFDEATGIRPAYGPN